MIKKLIAIFHILIWVYCSFYPFLISKNFYYDLLFILFNIFQVLLWIFNNNDCPITYLYQTYISKNNKHDISELINIPAHIDLFRPIFSVFISSISLYYTAIRSNIMSSFIILSFILIRILYIFYNCAIESNTRKIGHAIFGKPFSKIEKIYDDSGFHKMTESYFNNGILIIQILFLIYIFYHNKKRL